MNTSKWLLSAAVWWFSFQFSMGGVNVIDSLITGVPNLEVFQK